MRSKRLPTGLEGQCVPATHGRARCRRRKKIIAAHSPPPAPPTADGKIVFGHITMFGLMPSHHFNVWLDVKPAKGPSRRHADIARQHPERHGLLHFDPACSSPRRPSADAVQRRRSGAGQPHPQGPAVRRHIDEAADILRKSNNGLYTNEWLLADMKTNEIAMLELGTHASRLRRSSKKRMVRRHGGLLLGLQ